VTPSGETTVVAGTGQSGGSDGDAASATFSMPTGLAFDAQGALYVADMGNRKIRKIEFSYR
jgi:sugar lactone lactonase YvrE